MNQSVYHNLHDAKELIVNSAKGTNHDRVALVSNDRTWKAYNAGYTVKECLYEYDKMAEAVYKYHEDYNYDCYIDLGKRNKMRIMECLGPSGYILDESDNLSFIPIPMQDENKKIIEDVTQKGFKKYAYENLVPLYYGVNSKEEFAPKLKEAAKEYLLFAKDKGEIRVTMRDKYGVPSLNKGGNFYPLEHFFNSGVQGIKDLSISMRRHAKAFDECVNKLTETWKASCLAFLDSYVEQDEFVFPYSIGNLAQTVTSPKQFEKWYHPHQKWLAEELQKRGLSTYLNIEGSMAHLIDFYKDLPDGVFLALLESDDPAEFKKWCPNISIMGGYPTNYLGNKTVDECVDKAKELLDTVGYDGRWVYSEDKLLSYKNDVKAENLKAVTSYIRENGKL